MTKDDLPNEDALTVECLDLAVNYVLSGLVGCWDKLLSKCDDHVSILEDKIYENPADESMAPELWRNSSLWLKVEKLLSVQIATVTTVQEYLKEIALDEHDFFKDAGDRLKRVQNLITEELVKPTSSLTDLVSILFSLRIFGHLTVARCINLWKSETRDMKSSWVRACGDSVGSRSSFCHSPSWLGSLA
jgi:hypothetical protein